MADTISAEGMVGQPPRPMGGSEGSAKEVPAGGITQWGAVLTGAFAGFATAILMATLGAALGITAGAIGLNATTEGSPSDFAERAMPGVGIGMVVWTLLTAIVVGIVGGWALNRTARSERQYFPLTFGTLTWATGVFLVLMVVAPGWGGLLAGLGGAGGAMAGRSMEVSPRNRTEQAQPRSPSEMTDEERAQAKADADKVAQAAAAGSWLLFCGQVVSLASTILAAGWRRPAKAHLRTEIRLRPATSVT